jgi:hypothetical protein
VSNFAQTSLSALIQRRSRRKKHTAAENGAG